MPDNTEYTVRMDMEFYTVDGGDTDDAKAGITIWHGTAILRNYSSLPNYDLYTIRIVMDGVVHYFKNDHASYGDKKLKNILTGWLRKGRNKRMEGLLNE